MQNELTINLSDETYRGLMKLVGKQNASRFVEAVLRPYVLRGEKKGAFKINSPRLVDSSKIDHFKIQILDE